MRRPDTYFRRTGELSAMDRGLLARLNAERAGRRPAMVVTHLPSGQSRLITIDDAQKAAAGADPVLAEFAVRRRSGKSGLTADGETFLTIHTPPPRLVIIGAVHIAEALVPMAARAGFDCLVVDPRSAFAVTSKFAGAEVAAGWPEDVLSGRPLDAHTALAALSHDPKIDDAPLIAALETGCFFVGALGSWKTHGRRIERLEEHGLSRDAIDRIHAPIGLDIGAQTPAEIAVAILAELVKALRKDAGAGVPAD